MLITSTLVGTTISIPVWLISEHDDEIENQSAMTKIVPAFRILAGKPNTKREGRQRSSAEMARLSNFPFRQLKKAIFVFSKTQEEKVTREITLFIVLLFAIRSSSIHVQVSIKWFRRCLLFVPLLGQLSRSATGDGRSARRFAFLARPPEGFQAKKMSNFRVFETSA